MMARRPLWQRIRSLNPTLVVGVGLLVTGIGIALAAVTLSVGIDSSATLTGVLNEAARGLRTLILRGDDQLARFNQVVYDVVMAECPPIVGQAVSLTLAYLGELFSWPGLLTLLLLLGAYPIAARMHDARYSGPREPLG